MQAEKISGFTCDHDGQQEASNVVIQAYNKSLEMESKKRRKSQIRNWMAHRIIANFDGRFGADVLVKFLNKEGTKSLLRSEGIDDLLYEEIVKILKENGGWDAG